MKRSEINAIMHESIAFLNAHQFLLPPFAYWTPSEWRARGSEAAEIVESQLGWDITDFGLGDFSRVGLFLFTLRNGNLRNLEAMSGKLYAEKIMIVREGQHTPMHFHWQKMEDIINRGGGNLVIQLYNSSQDGTRLLDTDITVQRDGVHSELPAGSLITLHPGESVTLPAGLYHEFHGEQGQGTVLVGEVSRINDDRTDNRFFRSVGRFPQVTEDEPPLHLLVSDYGAYYRGGK